MHPEAAAALEDLGGSDEDGWTIAREGGHAGVVRARPQGAARRAQVARVRMVR
jgi:hypothetical protein